MKYPKKSKKENNSKTFFKNLYNSFECKFKIPEFKYLPKRLQTNSKHAECSCYSSKWKC